MSDRDLAARRRLILTVCALSVLIIGGLAVWSSRAQNRAAPAHPSTATKPAPKTVELRLQEGDEAVYVGSGTASTTWAGNHRSARFTFTLTETALERSERGGWKIGSFTKVSFPKNSQSYSYLSPIQTEVTTKGLWPSNPKAEVWSSDNWHVFKTPGWPGRKMRLGDEWEDKIPAGRNIYWYIPVRGVVAARERVAGRMCLRVELTPAEPLPMELKDRVVGEGDYVPARLMNFTDFVGRVWIAEDDGWVVKLERLVRIKNDSKTNPEDAWSMSMMLKSKRRLSSKELAETLIKLKTR